MGRWGRFRISLQDCSQQGLAALSHLHFYLRATEKKRKYKEPKGLELRKREQNWLWGSSCAWYLWCQMDHRKVKD